MKEKAILVAANHEKNLQLLADFLEDQGYRAEAAVTVAEVDEVLEGGPELDMALLDVTGFGDSIWDRCERIRKSGIPFFIISPRESRKAEKKSLSEGARDVLTKPLEKTRLLKLVEIILGE
ncbi:response regulator [Candidatus Bipolaricaulota bacterium]|nr:response regulator [Candidatus Bipolaricaulota bacterium]